METFAPQTLRESIQRDEYSILPTNTIESDNFIDKRTVMKMYINEE